MNFGTFYLAFASFPLTLGPHPLIHAAKSRFFPSSCRPQHPGNPTEKVQKATWTQRSLAKLDAVQRTDTPPQLSPS